jgi:hypothetical protein
MPTGVRLIKQNGKGLLVGQLFYYLTRAVLCSVCQELESVLTNRRWFVEAHTEYLNELKAKKRLLEGK